MIVYQGAFSWRRGLGQQAKTVYATTTLAIVVVFVALVTAMANAADVTVTGELKRWHKVTVTLDGPETSATATPNPFLDLRMDVTFQHGESGISYRVPGFFDADGDSANTSAHGGKKWSAIFRPDQTGEWTYRISFQEGPNVAVAESATEGRPLRPYHGLSGAFVVAETDKTGRDFRSGGRLEYVGKHHLQFAGSGEYFLKVGSDSPENILAYSDFDDTPNYTWEGRLGGGFRKSWGAHIRDWKSGDPTWKDGKGKGLIGAMNYLASKGMNSQSFLTYSTHGDDRNVSPYIDSEDRTRISIPKVSQWGIVFDHVQALGIFIEFKLMEVENDWDHDGGVLGPERKLYYRELIARFGHNLGLNWNIGEENHNTPAMRMAFAEYIHAMDPYHQLINIHPMGNWERLYIPLIGINSPYKGASLQIDHYENYDVTRYLRLVSQLAGVPWVITLDETRPGAAGRALNQMNAAVARDRDDPEHNDGRKGALWANLMAGGAGMNSYFGFGTDVGDPSRGEDRVRDIPDLMNEDFREYDSWWDQKRAAHSFFIDNEIPFQEMSPRAELVSRGWALADSETIVAYFPDGTMTGRVGPSGGLGYGPRPPGQPTPWWLRGVGDEDRPPKQLPGSMGGPGALEENPLDRPRHGQDPLSGRGTPPDSPTVDLRTFLGVYEILWFDPRKGGALQQGTVTTLVGGGGTGMANQKDHPEVGRPPTDPHLDWVVLIRPRSQR